MRYQHRPRQKDLFDSPDENLTIDALPLANQAEAILLLGKLLYEIVQAETKASETGGGNEQDHR
jgi:hypothetical protein